MSKPIRIQRKRTKGWKMPPDTIYVGRGSKWGNPFRVGDFGVINQHDAKERFYQWIGERRIVGPTPPSYDHLRGKNLACWCGLSSPCHADVLLDLANEETKP